MGVITATNFLYLAGWTSSPLFPEPFKALSLAQVRSLDHFLQACVMFSSVESPAFDLEVERKEVVARRMGYGGDGASVRRNLTASKVIAAWLHVGQASVCPIVDYIDEHLQDFILDPSKCLLPEAEWPTTTHRSKVHASEAEWYALVKAGVARNMFCEVAEGDIFRSQFGI